MAGIRLSPTIESSGIPRPKQRFRRIWLSRPGASLRPICSKRNLGIAYISAGMERRSPPFLIRGYRILAGIQSQFSTDSEVFTSMGNALLMGRQTSEAELAFERALQLNPNSVTARPMPRQPICRPGRFR